MKLRLRNWFRKRTCWLWGHPHFPWHPTTGCIYVGSLHLPYEVRCPCGKSTGRRVS